MKRRDKRVPRVILHGVPQFKNEAEEAAWWDAHPEVLTRAFQRAYGKQKRSPTKSVTIRLPITDVARARRFAGQKGLGYQTFVKTLLHEALNRQEREERHC